MKTTSTSANVSEWKKFFNGKTIALATALVMVLSFGTLGAYGAGENVENDAGTVTTEGTDETILDISGVASEVLFTMNSQVLEEEASAIRVPDGAIVFTVEPINDAYEVYDVAVNGGTVGDTAGTYEIPADMVHDAIVAGEVIYIGAAAQPVATEPAEEEQAVGDLITEPTELSPIVIKTPDADKPYDGEPLTTNVDEDGDGLPDGVTISFELVSDEDAALLDQALQTLVMTGSQTEEGTSPNYYSANWMGLDAKYGIVEELGTLTVTQRMEQAPAVRITAPSLTMAYTGEAIVAEEAGWTAPEGFTVDAVVEGSQTDVGTSASRVVSFIVYDPEGYDVTNEVDVAIEEGTLTVTPAVLKVETPSAHKTYDGTALTATADNWITGFVNGETATATLTGSQTEVGTSLNNFDIVWDGTAKEANYVVEAKLGTLEVLRVDPGETPYSEGNTTNNGGAANNGGGNAGGGTAAGNGGGTAVAPTATPIAGTPGVNYLSDSGATGTEVQATAADNATETQATNPVEAVAEGMQNVARGVIGEDPIPLTAPSTTELTEADTPLGAFDAPMTNWLRWYVILGILGTLLYGLAVLARRRSFTRGLENQENAMLGAEAEQAAEKAAVAADTVRGV